MAWMSLVSTLYSAHILPAFLLTYFDKLHMLVMYLEHGDDVVNVTLVVEDNFYALSVEPSQELP